MIKKLFTITACAFIINVTNAQIITTVCGNGTAGYSGDGGGATIAEISAPTGVAVDATGNLFIADWNNNCIRKVNTLGIISTVAGNGIGAGGFSGDGGAATNAALQYPFGITIDAIGNMYIADMYNNRIRKVNTLGIISTVAGGYGTLLGDGGQATAAGLNYPTGVVIDALGNMYIADVENNRIRKVNTLGIITTIAGNGTGAYAGDGGQATAAELSHPINVALDALGNMYIADVNSNRIRKVNTLGIITTIAGNGTGAYAGDGGIATAAELKYPYGITLDALGNMYIADYGNSRIRMINTTGIISTFAGNGTGGFSGDGGAATAAVLNYPQGVSLDALGNLYIADYGNNRIRMVTNIGQTTGIEKISNNIEATIYPNPNNGSFVIEPQNTLYNVHCIVYDVNGKVVLSQTIIGKTNIDASILNEGVYNISIISNEGVVNKRLVIVR